MNRDLSKQIMKEFKVISDSFNNLTDLSFQIDDMNQQKEFRKKIGLMYSELYINIIMPIELEFPDLISDSNRELS